MVRQTVDVIVVGNATTARAFQRATKTIPIVMGSANNPVGNGLVGTSGNRDWWSWGESNPRPKAIVGQIYTLS
jgi:ABC-type uncharacterized transport system substrate-binding protein